MICNRVKKVLIRRKMELAILFCLILMMNIFAHRNNVATDTIPQTRIIETPNWLTNGSFFAIYLLLVVTSAPENHVRRNIIRNTWGSQRAWGEQRIDVVFFIGTTEDENLQKQIEEERRTKQDIVQYEGLDLYEKLTTKSKVLLEWVVFHVVTKGSVQFVMKSDDDSFINMKNLKLLMASFPETTGVLVGRRFTDAKVIRNSSHKWYVPYSAYGKDIYPTYLAGNAYIMSIDVVMKLHNACNYNKGTFPLEDVYITGFCASKAGITSRNIPLMMYDWGSVNESTICAHHVSGLEILNLWKIFGSN